MPNKVLNGNNLISYERIFSLTRGGKAIKGLQLEVSRFHLNL